MKCEDCLFFNGNEKDHRIKFNYRKMLEDTRSSEEERNNLKKEGEAAYEKSGMCCRYPTPSYTRIGYFCGEFKPKN